MNIAALTKNAMAIVPADLKSAAVFSRVTQAENEDTGVVTPSTSTISGTAVQDKGDPKRYERLGLVESEAPTLFFVPGTAGECPEPGDTVTWGDVAFTTRDVDPIAPAGTVIAASCVVAR